MVINILALFVPSNNMYKIIFILFKFIPLSIDCINTSAYMLTIYIYTVWFLSVIVVYVYLSTLRLATVFGEHSVILSAN